MMLSLKIQNVAVILEQLAMRATTEEEKSLLSVCKNVLDDAADQAVDYENMPLSREGAAEGCPGVPA